MSANAWKNERNAERDRHLQVQMSEGISDNNLTRQTASTYQPMLSSERVTICCWIHGRLRSKSGLVTVGICLTGEAFMSQLWLVARNCTLVGFYWWLHLSEFNFDAVDWHGEVERGFVCALGRAMSRVNAEWEVRHEVHWYHWNKCVA